MTRLGRWAGARRERRDFPETIPDQWRNLVDWARYLFGEVVAAARQVWRRVLHWAGWWPCEHVAPAPRMTLDQALFQRDGYQQAYERCRDERDAARARIAELEADLLKIEEFRADLAERCFLLVGELDAARARIAETNAGDQG